MLLGLFYLFLAIILLFILTIAYEALISTIILVQMFPLKNRFNYLWYLPYQFFYSFYKIISRVIRG